MLRELGLSVDTRNLFTKHSAGLFSTRSVGTSLARRFNAGSGRLAGVRRVATIEFALISRVATGREFFSIFPDLERPG